MRTIAIVFTILSLVGCAAAAGPAGQPSSSNVNPETGSRGGSGTK